MHSILCTLLLAADSVSQTGTQHPHISDVCYTAGPPPLTLPFGVWHHPLVTIPQIAFDAERR